MYSAEAIRAANEKLKKRREAAEQQSSMRREEIYQKIPAVSELDRKLSVTAYEMVALVARGSVTDETVALIREKNERLRMLRAETLVEHGYPLDYLEIKHTCKKCADRGYIGEKRCACLEKELQKSALECFEIMKKYKDADLKNFRLDFYSGEREKGVSPEELSPSPRERMTRVFSHCERFVKEFGARGESLLLYGEAGLGKTFLSVAVAKELIRLGHHVAYYTAQDLFSLFEREKFSQEDLKQEISQVFACELLIIDDLGTEFMTSFIPPTLYNILNRRILEIKSTIISTNFSPEEIFSMYSPQVTSRLKGDFTFLEFLGEDIRFIKRKNEIRTRKKSKTSSPASGEN